MCKGPVVKLLIGVLLIIAGVFAILPEWIAKITVLQITSGFAWEAFKTVILGAIPPMLIFLGALIVWIEIEEIKIERMEKEIEEKEKEETKKK
ncbi:MAG TPA: hypothetical protein EYH56_02170 [Nanoarchaeota archaeon]|nr:hypothetical protein [Nanoarchaeota archaeon]